MLKTIEGEKAGNNEGDKPGNNELTKRSFCQIEIRLLPAKLSFFLLKASACTLPFINVFLISIGFSASQVGVITGISGAIWAILGWFSRLH